MLFDLNTLYVDIKPLLSQCFPSGSQHLNTLYVDIKRNKFVSDYGFDPFKYIIC